MSSPPSSVLQGGPVIYARAVFVGDLLSILSAIIVRVKKIAQYVAAIQLCHPIAVQNNPESGSAPLWNNAFGRVIPSVEDEVGYFAV
jgi:hypothetical protein